MVEEIKHELQLMGLGCTCGDPYCRKWKENFRSRAKEIRCPICQRLASITNDGKGNDYWHCIHCSKVIEKI